MENKILKEHKLSEKSVHLLIKYATWLNSIHYSVQHHSYQNSVLTPVWCFRASVIFGENRNRMHQFQVIFYVEDSKNMG